MVELFTWWSYHVLESLFFMLYASVSSRSIDDGGLGKKGHDYYVTKPNLLSGSEVYFPKLWDFRPTESNACNLQLSAYILVSIFLSC